ncbi:hypothetical protein [Cellulomonas sp. URHE0023]|uniref:hypothetical protein n=1 Tax=Cellulomonas sp. URHE0023 TaxID=1380354 RepID=UPI000488F6A0|nr:hypothetical protein [Cellulomonas sp. URHE0023]
MLKITDAKRSVLTTATAATMAGLTIGILSGCTASAHDGNASGAQPAASAPATSVPPMAVEAGAPVTADQVLPERTTAYALPDGTFVAVVRDQPLPAPVQAAIEAGALAAIPLTADGGFDTAETTLHAAYAFAGSASHDTGKKIAVVYQFGARMSWGIDTPITVGWQGAISTQDVPKSFKADLDSTLVVVQEFISAQKDPADWAIVIRR